MPENFRGTRSRGGRAVLLALLALSAAACSVVRRPPPAAAEVRRILAADAQFNKPVKAPMPVLLTGLYPDEDVSFEKMIEDQPRLRLMRDRGLLELEASWVSTKVYYQSSAQQPLDNYGQRYLAVPVRVSVPCWSHRLQVRLSPEAGVESPPVPTEEQQDRLASEMNVMLMPGQQTPLWGLYVRAKEPVAVGAVEVIDVEGAKPMPPVAGREEEAAARFSYRFRPNTVGEFFDRTSPTYQQLPESLRTAERNQPKPDSRLRFGGFDSSQVISGHVIFRRSGLGWEVKKISFDSFVS